MLSRIINNARRENNMIAICCLYTAAWDKGVKQHWFNNESVKEAA